jgi:hypothetical protein
METEVLRNIKEVTSLNRVGCRDRWHASVAPEGMLITTWGRAAQRRHSCTGAGRRYGMLARLQSAIHQQRSVINHSARCSRSVAAAHRKAHLRTICWVAVGGLRTTQAAYSSTASRNSTGIHSEQLRWNGTRKAQRGGTQICCSDSVALGK